MNFHNVTTITDSCRITSGKMTISAWYMDDDIEADQRTEHKLNPSEDVSLEKLASLGSKQ